MDNSTQEGGTLTVPDNPALVAAKAEHQKVMTDPAHPHHFGFTRGAQAANDYVYGLYKKAVPATMTPATPADLASRHEQDPTITLEDRVAQTQTEHLLRDSLGDLYDSTMRDMGIGAQHLFATPEGAKILEALSPLICDLGELAQVRAIRFLAELGELVTYKQHGGKI